VAKEYNYKRKRLQTSYLSSIIGITLVLYVLGLLGVIYIEFENVSKVIKEKFLISVIMKDDAKEADIFLLQKTLDAASYVKQTEYVTKDQAAKQLEVDLGEDFIGCLGFNPLLPSIEVKLNAEWVKEDSLTLIKEQLMLNESIKEISYPVSLIDLMNNNLMKISLLLSGFSLLFLFITIVLINNTIRLAVYSKRFLIKSMQLVGATQSFIRRPFLVKGVVQGIISAFSAIGLLVLTIDRLVKGFPELKDLVEIEQIDKYLYTYLYLCAFILLVGILITWISTYFAVRKYLKIKTDNLYYY